MNDPQHTQHYSFHGVEVSVTAGRSLSKALHSRLRQFETNESAGADLVFEFCHVGADESHMSDQPPRAARRVYEPATGRVLYADDGDRLWLDGGNNVRAACDPVAGRTRVTYSTARAGNLWLVSHPMFTLPFIESLKRRGLYSVHAAGLCVGGRGLLLAGASGSGKTTAALALARAGFGFLGDDMTFLRASSGGLSMLAFPDEVDLTDETIRMFPELRGMLARPRPNGRPKLGVRIGQLCRGEVVLESQPAVLIFTRVADAEKSVLQPVGKGEALTELVPNVLLTEARAAQSHLDALARLVRETECYRLDAGRDLTHLPELIAETVTRPSVARGAR